MLQLNLGTNDLAQAESFYNALLPLAGGVQAYKTDRSVIYALAGGSARLAVNKPYDGEPATPGNGVMATLYADDKRQVDMLYRKALALGGSSEGEPGDRLDGVVYAAYFRDLDGNKFGVIHVPGQ